MSTTTKRYKVLVGLEEGEEILAGDVFQSASVGRITCLSGNGARAEANSGWWREIVTTPDWEIPRIAYERGIWQGRAEAAEDNLKGIASILQCTPNKIQDVVTRGVERLGELGCSADAWEKSANYHAHNESYYRSLLGQIGNLLGEEAFIADDGSVSDTVLNAKLPELVEKRLSGWTPGQAIFLFCSWLTTRDEVVSFGATQNAGRAAELAGAYCRANGLPVGCFNDLKVVNPDKVVDCPWPVRECEPGYRWVRPDEVIQEGDECVRGDGSIHSDLFHLHGVNPSIASPGPFIVPYGYYRRKIEAVRADSKGPCLKNKIDFRDIKVPPMPVNEEALRKEIETGLQQSLEGKVKDLGSFAHHASETAPALPAQDGTIIVVIF